MVFASVRLRSIEIRQPARRGQAAVEFALVLIVLMALLYGIIEISRLMLINAEVENAAREAAQYAALQPGVTSAYLKTNVIGPKLTLIDRNSPDFVVKGPCFPRAYPDGKCACLENNSPCPNAGVGPFYPVSVKVSYTWRSWVNIIPDMSTFTLTPLGPLTLQATATKMIEGR